MLEPVPVLVLEPVPGLEPEPELSTLFASAPHTGRAAVEPGFGRESCTWEVP